MRLGAPICCIGSCIGSWSGMRADLEPALGGRGGACSHPDRDLRSHLQRHGFRHRKSIEALGEL